jgi:outer membrane immunogenic protein
MNIAEWTESRPPLLGKCPSICASNVSIRSSDVRVLPCRGSTIMMRNSKWDAGGILGVVEVALRVGWGSCMKPLFVFATVAVAYAGSAALAADMPVKTPAAPAPFSWAGLYVGVNGGYGWGRSNSSDAGFGGTPMASISPRGGFGGAQAGYTSLLTPHWLLGTEFDFDWGDINGSAPAFRNNGVAPKVDSIRVQSFGTIRQRVGYVMDRSLIYATAGAAWARGNWSTAGGPLEVPGSIGDDHVGWTAGVGYEYAFAPRWSAKVEYLYADLRQWRVTENFIGGGLRTVDLKLNTVKLGLNYRLDDAAATAPMPVTAPAAPSSWAGSYIGANVGYGWGTYNLSNNVFVGNPQDPVKLSPNGVLGGVQGGYNWLVTPTWLVGVESDFDFGRLNASGASARFNLASDVKIDDFATVRGRVAYVAGPALFYATGGFAYAHEKGVCGNVIADDHEVLRSRLDGGRRCRIHVRAALVREARVPVCRLRFDLEHCGRR